MPVLHKQTVVQTAWIVADADGNCTEQVAQIVIPKFVEAEFAQVYGELAKARAQLEAGTAPETAAER